MSIRYILPLASILVNLIGCSGLNYVDVTSTNQNSRVNYLVIHATSELFQESLRLLSTPNSNPVSSHYLIPYLEDPTYQEDNLRVYRLVSEERRAWHAGVSQWAEEIALNDRSIGIEIVNDFKCKDENNLNRRSDSINLECSFPTYPKNQINLVLSLIKDILKRHPEIDPVDIVAHSDIAPNRKSDPGPKFPWEEFYKHGIGAWYDISDFNEQLNNLKQQPPSILDVQCALSIYGYPIELTGVQDRQSLFAIRAFQLHFRPSSYSGLIDEETTAILYALNKKYRSELVGNKTSCEKYGDE
jgi:N-acetyl-anhydromuramyl-L-alanine amidase AmpD